MKSKFVINSFPHACLKGPSASSMSLFINYQDLFDCRTSSNKIALRSMLTTVCLVNSLRPLLIKPRLNLASFYMFEEPQNGHRGKVLMVILFIIHRFT